MAVGEVETIYKEISIWELPNFRYVSLAISHGTDCIAESSAMERFCLRSKSIGDDR